jgi:hypothetical protein
VRLTTILARAWQWFHRWRQELAQDRALVKLNSALTPGVVSEILRSVGRHIERGSRRASDLPYPRALIETAFVIALQDTKDEPTFETVATTYSILDDHMLSDADAAALKRFWAGVEPFSLPGIQDLIDRANAAGDAAVAEALKGTDIRALITALGPYSEALRRDEALPARALVAAGMTDVIRINEDLARKARVRLSALDSLKTRRRLTPA